MTSEISTLSKIFTLSETSMLSDMYMLLPVWIRKWVGILFTPCLRFTAATMNMREGFDLRVCHLLDGSALLYVPHGYSSGMFCYEVEAALCMNRARRGQVRPSSFVAWVNAGEWSDLNRRTVTERKMISITNNCMPVAERRLSPWMIWMIQWRMRRDADLDVTMRHYQNILFMTCLYHLWLEIHRTPEGFVERWALRGPEAMDEARAEAETLKPS